MWLTRPATVAPDSATDGRRNALPDTLTEDLSSSALFVHYILAEADEPLTQKAIIARTRLSGRAVRGALSRLEDAGLVSTRPSLTDARQSLYSLTDQSGEEEETPSVRSQS